MSSTFAPPSRLIRQPAWRRLADAVLAAMVVLMVGMMIVPLPTLLLDILLTSNISIAVLMLLVAMYLSDGLSFSAFPTVLLVTTLYRLALNVSSTRLILLQADAGEVIESFGEFVVQGNYVVGAVVFLILTLIQFLVIAKGSERVAEVGARFTLDAMPGKQMSIDAELRSGAVTQEQARAKRHHLQRESQFYGAMDGAMKFVKGDAIAGLIIIAINIIGGLVVGVALHGLPLEKSLRVYGLLTIGDGLVSQIPALLVSTAAGLVVTRVASERDGSLGSDIASQIFGNAKALVIAAVFLIVLGLLPGLPAVPFLLLGTVFGVTGHRLQRQVQRDEDSERSSTTDPGAPPSEEAPRTLTPMMLPLSVRLDPALEAQLSKSRNGLHATAYEQGLSQLRMKLYRDLGLSLPPVSTRADPTLPAGAYAIDVQEVPCVHGAIVPDKHLVVAEAQQLASLGFEAEPALDPLTGSPACWVGSAHRAALESRGIIVRSSPELVLHHLERVTRQQAYRWVGLQETQAMLDQLERTCPALVRHVVPKPVSLAQLADVLRRLVEEQISIRPLREILEALAIYGPQERDPVTLTELVRSALRRHITHAHTVQGKLYVHLLDPSIEEAVRDSIQRSATGSFLALAPEAARDIVEGVRAQLKLGAADGPAVVLTQADVRRFVRRLLEVELPEVRVLSYQELAPDAVIEPLGRVELGSSS